MDKDSQNDTGNRETIISRSVKGLLDFNRRINNKFIYVQCDFVNVIRDLVSETEKLKANPKISIQFANIKEDQIDRLINYNNVVEQILEEYKQHLTALKLTSDIIERTFLDCKELDELILRNKALRDEFLKF